MSGEGKKPILSSASREKRIQEQERRKEDEEQLKNLRMLKEKALFEMEWQKRRRADMEKKLSLHSQNSTTFLNNTDVQQIMKNHSDNIWKKY